MTNKRIGVFIVCIFILSFFIYISNFHTMQFVDNEPTIRLPISIFEFNRIDLDLFYPEYIKLNNNLSYFYIEGLMLPIRLKNNHIYAEKSTGMAIFISPIFYTVFKYIDSEDVNPKILQRREFLNYLNISGKITAGLLASLAVVILFLVCQIIFNNRSLSLLLTLIYAFGTSHWTISSQALWVHGGVEFWLLILILSMLLYDKTKLDKYLYLSSASAGMVSIIRIDGLIYFFFVLLYIYRIHNNKIIKYLSISSILIIVYYSFNLLVLGHLIGGYGDTGAKPFYMFPVQDIILAFLGMFVSPGRGLFFFTPILIFSFIGMYILIKRNCISRYSKIWIYFIPSVILIIFIHTIYTDNSNYLKWYGGWNWGPRYFVDTMPLLLIYLGISIVELNKITIKA